MIKLPDYFDSLVEQARVRAEKAMVKFPQPNYVLNKVAEESGEVIKSVIHYTEGRETWENVEAELIDNLAMLIRLVKEGDQVIGFTPPAEVQRLNSNAQPVSDGWVKCSERMPIDIDEVRAYKSIEVLATDGHFVTAIDCIAGIPNGKREEFWCTFSPYGNMNPKEITHWMPLPAAPGGQDD